MFSKRKLDDPHPYNEEDVSIGKVDRIINFESINRNVKSNTGKIKTQTLVTRAEEVFKEFLPSKYEATETPKQLIISIYFPNDPIINEFQINELKETCLSCYLKYNINFKEKSLTFYLVSSSTGSVTTHLIREVKTSLLITNSEYTRVGTTDFVPIQEGSSEGFRIGSNNNGTYSVVSRDVSGFRN
jgi:hypothetical protein